MCNAFFPTDYNTAATVLASFGISLGTMIMNPLSGKVKPQNKDFRKKISNKILLEVNGHKMWPISELLVVECRFKTHFSETHFNRNYNHDFYFSFWKVYLTDTFGWRYRFLACAVILAVLGYPMCFIWGQPMSAEKYKAFKDRFMPLYYLILILIVYNLLISAKKLHFWTFGRVKRIKKKIRI